MLYNFLTKYKFLSTTLLGIFLILSPLDYVEASNAKIYASNMQITQIKDNRIEGNFKIWNSENYYFTGINYEIKLFKGTVFGDLKLIDIFIPNKTFILSPKEELTESFIYQYPENISSGKYTIRTQVISDKGIELGWDDRIVELQGNNIFLNVVEEFSRVLINGRQGFPQEGINVLPKDTVNLYFKLENPGDTINIVPKIKIYQRQINMTLLKEYSDSPITLSKGETKEVNLVMPKLETPESYYAEVRLYKNNKQVSGVQYFRWVVEGASGEILSIKTDKDNYAPGEEMIITIDSVGPADLTTINGCKLETIVYNQNKKIILKKAEDIDLSMGVISSEIKIPINENVFSPTIEVKITKDGNILDKYKITVSPTSEKAKKMESQARFYKYIIYSVIILLIIIFIIGFTFFKLKINKK